MNPKWLLKKTLTVIGKKPKEPRYVPVYDGKDPKHLAFLRTLACAVQTYPFPGTTSCSGIVEAHHNTHGRGKSQRTDDRRAFPLCAFHHRPSFHERAGAFYGWDQAKRNRWQDRMSRKYAPKAA